MTNKVCGVGEALEVHELFLYLTLLLADDFRV